MTYNFVITENKIQSEYLNFYSEKDFFEKLWEWTYVDDLWDFIKENPDNEDIIHYIENIFIDDNIFHKWEEDDLTCYAFKIDNGIVYTYNWGQSLEDFVINKIKEHYEK